MTLLAFLLLTLLIILLSFFGLRLHAFPDFLSRFEKPFITMFNFLNNFLKSKGIYLVIFILMNAAVILGVNLLFQIPSWKPFFENKLFFVSFGAFIYALWLIFIFALLKKSGHTFQNLTLTPLHLKQALTGAVLLFILLNILFIYFANNIGKGLTISNKFNTLSSTTQTLGVFLFNILPGAFIEEISFRAFLLPQLYLIFNARIKRPSLSIILAILISTFIFGISHIPRDLLRFDFNLMNFWSNSGYLFTNGVVYSIIFLLTRNIWFTVFCHAFFNFSVVVIASESSSGFFSLVFGVALALLWRRMFPVKPQL
jgi:membrane protease YdiL (CAAX protease family)